MLVELEKRVEGDAKDFWVHCNRKEIVSDLDLEYFALGSVIDFVSVRSEKCDGGFGC